MGPPTSPPGPVASCLLSSFFLWLQALSFLGDLLLFSHSRAHSRAHSRPLVFLHLKLLQLFFSQHSSCKSALYSSLLLVSRSFSHRGRSAPTNLVSPSCCGASGLLAGPWPGLRPEPWLLAPPSSRASWPLWVSSIPPPLPSRFLTPMTPVLRSWGDFSCVSSVSFSPYMTIYASYLPVSCLFLLVCLFFPQNGNSLTRIK